jgi:hypothetical protein
VRVGVLTDPDTSRRMFATSTGAVMPLWRRITIARCCGAVCSAAEAPDRGDSVTCPTSRQWRCSKRSAPPLCGKS